MVRNPTVRTSDTGRTFAVVGDIYRFLATCQDTDGKYAMWEAIVPPGSGPPPHVHSREEEGFLVLEGEITFLIGDDRFVARAGTFANIPVGTLHSFKNETNETAKMIITIAPAGLEQMFFAIGLPLPQGATGAPHPTKTDIDNIIAIAPQYGIEIPCTLYPVPCTLYPVPCTPVGQLKLVEHRQRQIAG